MNLMKSMVPVKIKQTEMMGSKKEQKIYSHVGSESRSDFKKIYKSKVEQKSREKTQQKKTSKQTVEQVGESKKQIKNEASKKLENLEQKLNKLKQDPSKKELVVKIEKILNKLKVLLKSGKNPKKLLSLKDDKKDENLMDLLKELSSLIDEVLSFQKKDQFEKKLSNIEIKLDQMSQIKNKQQDLGAELNIKGKFAEKPADKPKAPKKVTVKDLRTQKTHTLKNPNKTSQNTTKAVKQKPKTENLKAQPKGQEEKVKLELTQKPLENLQQGNIKQAVHSYTRSTAPIRANIEAMFQNISGRAAFTLKDGKSELKMNLNPAELGKMLLKFDSEDGVMTAKIVVSTQEAKNLFDQNLPDLQKHFEQAGINIGGMDVSLGNQSEQGDGSGQFSSGMQSGLVFGQDFSEEVGSDARRVGLTLNDSQVNFIA